MIDNELYDFIVDTMIETMDMRIKDNKKIDDYPLYLDIDHVSSIFSRTPDFFKMENFSYKKLGFFSKNFNISGRIIPTDEGKIILDLFKQKVYDNLSFNNCILKKFEYKYLIYKNHRIDLKEPTHYVASRCCSFLDDGHIVCDEHGFFNLTTSSEYTNMVMRVVIDFEFEKIKEI